MNRFGSEILKRCIELFLLLKKKDSNFSLPRDLNLFGIEKYIEANPTPIIIEIFDVDDNDLVKEDGKTAGEALNFLRAVMPTMPERLKYKFLQHCNFELLKRVPVNRLKFYRLEFNGHPALPNFVYNLEPL
ncbi:MAG TPA: hypothetical protein VD884_01095 [Ohtaekwangia sp.]|nr:hypothetical protein [Ohtaekwangia sp.]